VDETREDRSEREQRRILVVDDDERTLKNIRKALSKTGYSVSTSNNPVRARDMLLAEAFDLLITDRCMPHMDGLDLLGEARRSSPGLEVIVITGYPSIDGAVQATKQGAYYYLAKPFTPIQLRDLVEETMQQSRLREAALAEEDEGAGPVLIGNSAAMRQVEDVIRQIAPTDCNVLITGESGTGKELVARAIHAYSSRAYEPFLAFNCGAFSEDLIANELFGHEREAFTGAASRKVGLLEAAEGGTLLLDEIGDMPLSMQVKLLRVLQEREVVRVGGTKSIPLDVRVVAATARDLRAAVAEGAFRQDLFFRLNVVNIGLPRLRERREDILLLAYHFLHKYTNRMNKPVDGISPEALDVLSGYGFPGNVRELENIVERAVAVSQTRQIQPRDLPPELVKHDLNSFTKSGEPGMTLDEIERDYIRRVLAHTGGARARAAEILGIDRTSLWRKMKKYGID
jgi:DNA-binding NtrC family response regulator